MAYFVAKELHMRPMDILTQWNCEELLVAYGYYADQKSAQYVDMTPKKEWAKKHITWLDRWAVLFITKDQAEELTRDEKEADKSLKDADSLANASQILFGK
jgi:hypothetical protein